MMNMPKPTAKTSRDYLNALRMCMHKTENLTEADENIQLMLEKDAIPDPQEIDGIIGLIEDDEKNESWRTNYLRRALHYLKKWAIGRLSGEDQPDSPDCRESEEENELEA